MVTLPRRAGSSKKGCMGRDFFEHGLGGGQGVGWGGGKGLEGRIKVVSKKICVGVLEEGVCGRRETRCGRECGCAQLLAASIPIYVGAWRGWRWWWSWRRVGAWCMGASSRPAYFFQWVMARSAIVTQTRHPPMPIQAVAGCHTSISGVRGAGGEYVHPFGALPMTVCFHLFFFPPCVFSTFPPPRPFFRTIALVYTKHPSQITHRDGAREGKHTHTMRGRCGHFLTTARKKNDLVRL